MPFVLYPKSFYFTRHGESEWNVLKKFAGGQMDTPLTDKGRAQAASARKIFDNLYPKPTHIIHSTLSRATETAQILNENLSLPMIDEYNLREIDAGEWQGINSHTAIKNWDEGLKPNCGESFEEFSNRIQMTLNDILKNDCYNLPCVAAHGRILNSICIIYGIKPKSLQMQNCEILYFVPKTNKNFPWDVFTVTTLNKTSSHKKADWSKIY